MFMVQFTGPPAHVSSAERGRQHENIQYTGCIHSALFLLSHLNSIYLTQSCRNFQDLLVQASWPLPSLSFTRPEQSNMAQHPPSHWIPRGNSGHCWESLAQVSPLLFKYFYFLFLTLHHTHTSFDVPWILFLRCSLIRLLFLSPQCLEGRKVEEDVSFTQEGLLPFLKGGNHKRRV